MSLTSMIPGKLKTLRWDLMRFLHRIKTNKVGMASLGFLIFLVLACWIGPLLISLDPNVQDVYNRGSGPSSEHWLGTDAFGRDILVRLLAAGQTSLIAAAQATGLAMLIGIPLGLAAGYIGGIVDTVLSRIVDTILSMPALVLVFAIVGVTGPGLTSAMMALGFIVSTEFYRVSRAASDRAAGQLYVTAARAVGVPPYKLLFRHVLINVASPLIVQASFCIGLVIMAEASLSFIGVGVQLPQASWGSMVREGFDQIYSYPALVIPPTIAIITTVLAFSLFGDAVRDALGRDSTRE